MMEREAPALPWGALPQASPVVASLWPQSWRPLGSCSTRLCSGAIGLAGAVPPAHTREPIQGSGSFRRGGSRSQWSQCVGPGLSLRQARSPLGWASLTPALGLWRDRPHLRVLAEPRLDPCQVEGGTESRSGPGL
ncbi:serum amyloid P-component-like [Platysternon megacephalum]|uniref:Serum amyloid P-component-like n=1 Tax=Platysternon megacephalum TaxID=55544 RepID=A0A4D9DWJ5_9SAUR|nr:serum amyloid P-component-like [Platysternon megacephalum]